MHLRRLANLWILLFVAAGLLLAPVASAFARLMPNAASTTMQAMSDEQAISDEQAMADDMPCCPDQTKNRTCDDCPWLALCMFAVSLPVPVGAASLVERYPLRRELAPGDDRLRDGLGADPPDHPPRTNV
ncbi:hypothetical protein [Bradyrhizobium lablabi]|uniref:hypothetical protein n=1 Tax=Bradyrhizobium lablabi TaxID=722472 RepID=UPI001BA46FE8|nr:hypothetical protein [Bradyrhizobium lablabi]MBR0692787.1 hypothetical protein [Bradyrhizobium lablabi]